MARTIEREEDLRRDEQLHAEERRREARDMSDDYAVDETNHTVVNEDEQRSQFGGFKLGSAFFGWLVSSGLSTILLALLAAGGTAFALTQVRTATGVTGDTAQTVGLISGLVFVIVMAIAYYAGGYVAGRLARFNGMRQGMGVWALGVLATLVLGVLGTALGAKYNILAQLNLPHLPLSGDAFTTGGIITSLATLLTTLLAAVLGGKAGTRYHRKVDAAGEVDARNWLGGTRRWHSHAH